MVDAVVLGIDALDSYITKKLFAEGYMGNFAEQVENGNLELEGIPSWKKEGQKVPFTGLVWPSIYCGGGPEVHGHDKAGMKHGFANFATDIPETIFDDASNAGLKVASLRMPTTWPARPVNGFMVAGFPSGRDENVTESEVDGETLQPEDLPDDYSDYRERDLVNKSDSAVKIREYLKAEDRRFDILYELMEENGGQDSYDVVFYGTQLPDKFGHKFHRDLDEEGTFDDSNLAKLGYQKMDEIFGKCIDRWDPEKIIGISDHGFNLEKNTHSMRSAIFEYDRTGDIHGFDGMTNVLDFRDYFLSATGLPESDSVYEPVEGAEVSDEEMADVEERLEDLGYMDEGGPGV